MHFLLIFILTLFILPNVTLASNEGSGLLSSDSNGALPKALWLDQPRSEIAHLLKNMPSDAPLRSLQQIKRNMLLSNYDVSLIKNDIKLSPENNLLTLRLQKLIEMGLWEEAFRLYTVAVNDPQDNSLLAQTGILLVLLEKGLPTACLEEKAFNSRFSDSLLWAQLSSICDIELGSILLSTADFAGSETLRNIYEDDNFKIPAAQITQLLSLSNLELAVLSLKGRINYNTVVLTEQIPARIIKTYLKDSHFPPELQKKLNKIATHKAILPEAELSDVMQNYTETLKVLSQKELIELIAKKLKLNQAISEQEYQKLYQLAPNNPENYLYLKYISIFQPIETEVNIPEKDVLSSGNLLSVQMVKKVNFLKSLLDKSTEFSNNPANVYEKHISTASNGNTIAKGNQIDWLKDTLKSNYAGLSLLIMLSNIENSTWAKSSVDTSEKKTFNMLKSLSEVGLIDQAHQVAKEELANLMMSYKN